MCVFPFLKRQARERGQLLQQSTIFFALSSYTVIVAERGEKIKNANKKHCYCWTPILATKRKEGGEREKRDGREEKSREMAISDWKSEPSFLLLLSFFGRISDR